MDTLALIAELINKECERYELDKNGFITDRGELVRILLQSKYAYVNENCTQEEFEEWKKNILAHLYTLKDFSGYLCRKQKSRPLYQLTRRLTRNIISRLRKENVAITLDQELRLSSQRTLAFKLSAALFAEIYHEIFSPKSMYITPAQIEIKCESSAKELYPIDCNSLVSRLKQNDNEFWNEMTKVIKNICSQVIRYKNIKANSEELTENIFPELLLSFHEQVRTGRAEHLISGVHLLHSLKLTCLNKLYEYFRLRDKRKEELLDDSEWDSVKELSISDAVESEDFVNNLLTYLLDVDENNEYELSCAIVNILCHGKGSIYQWLTSGQEDKIRVLMMHAYQQMEYEDIARKLYGTAGNIKCSNLRQMVRRVKIVLKKRMKDIIIRLKETGYNNLMPQ